MNTTDWTQTTTLNKVQEQSIEETLGRVTSQGLIIHSHRAGAQPSSPVCTCQAECRWSFGGNLFPCCLFPVLPTFPAAAP